MAEQIVTLGIGASPASLTPFITSGLEIGASVVVFGSVTIADAAWQTMTAADAAWQTMTAADAAWQTVTATDDLGVS